MSVQTVVLNGGEQLTNTGSAVIIGGAALKTVITKARLTNSDAAVAYTFSIYRVNGGDASGADNILINERSIAPKSTDLLPELNGMTLNPGDNIAAIASTTLKLNFFASGYTSTQ